MTYRPLFLSIFFVFCFLSAGCNPRMMSTPDAAQESMQAGATGSGSGGRASGTSGARVTNFEECVAAGFVITRSFPPKCVTPNGQQFVKPRVAPSGSGGCENLCGDGVCQQIVCMAVGCPCAETPVNCANDCANSSF